ncbi:hypothetical protein PILCRDRAFT_815319 [Piloderma croceum F 1598]|uniref:Uncharacterized protein n=1 Tax=Piloderma croceum (strain F 1598) TaxID=765440 RepID=A0A0C3CB03_PILCF|nr:hypothetical protein PILCRDRAFT_815319 [Piloderma croceum F 1598]
MNYSHPADETSESACPSYKPQVERSTSAVALSIPIGGRKKFGKITAGVGGNGGNAQLMGGAGGKGGKFTFTMAAQTEYEVDDIEAGAGGAGGDGKKGGDAGAGGEVKITEEPASTIIESVISMSPDC